MSDYSTELSIRERNSLLYGDGFGEVAGLVYVAAAADGDVVGEELQGDDLHNGRRSLGRASSRRRGSHRHRCG